MSPVVYSNHSDGLIIMVTFATINVCLSQGSVIHEAREVVGTVDCIMINKEGITFEAAVIFFQKLAFGLQEGTALFTRGVGRSSGSRSIEGSMMVVCVWDTTHRFCSGVCMT